MTISECILDFSAKGSPLSLTINYHEFMKN